jgi:hypothetical protein
MNASGEDLEKMTAQMEARQLKLKAEKKAKKMSQVIKTEVPDEDSEKLVVNPSAPSTSNKANSTNSDKINGDKSKLSK